MKSLRTPREAKSPSPRMGALARLPLFFALAGKRAVVAGGNAAAAWKVELLSAAGACVDVYADEISCKLRQLAAELPAGAVVPHGRSWRTSDLAGAAIAVGAFDDDAGAAEFAAATRAAGVPVNVIDKPAFSDFSFGSIVNRSPLVIGISTDGAAPVFAQAIRARLEALLPKGFAAWAAAAARWRGAVTSSGLPLSARRKFWRLFAAHAMAHPQEVPKPSDCETILAAANGPGEGAECGAVTLVGAGPGDPELLTLRAVRAMQAADVIVYDEFVSAEMLDFARREAKKIFVGKSACGPSREQEDTVALIVALARQGRRVVHLKGGDAPVFADAELTDACRAADLPVDVVPGIDAPLRIHGLNQCLPFGGRAAHVRAAAARIAARRRSSVDENRMPIAAAASRNCAFRRGSRRRERPNVSQL